VTPREHHLRAKLLCGRLASPTKRTTLKDFLDPPLEVACVQHNCDIILYTTKSHIVIADYTKVTGSLEV